MSRALTRSDARPWWRRASSILLWLPIVLTVLLVAGWFATLPASPDGFYDPPADVPGRPGRIVRMEPMTRGVPEGARGWRFLYTTTRQDGAPAVASAVMLVPDGGSAPRPLIAWAHGTTGIARGCAPSLMADPFAGTPAVADLIKNGWAMVATDYVGMGTPGNHAYLVGEDAARAVLDSIRAAAGHREWQLSGAAVVWGHSQGGHSALWAGIAAPRYAPDVMLRGVAAMAPASDLPALTRESGASGFGKLISAFVYQAYRQVYPDVAAMPVSRLARIASADMARRCIVDRKALWTVGELWLLRNRPLLPAGLGSHALDQRLRQNSPFGPIQAPLLIAQGEADESVSSNVQRRFVKSRCAAGQPLRYLEYPSVDHMGLIKADSPFNADLLAWTSARFAAASLSGDGKQRPARPRPPIPPSTLTDCGETATAQMAHKPSVQRDALYRG